MPFNSAKTAGRRDIPGLPPWPDSGDRKEQQVWFEKLYDALRAVIFSTAPAPAGTVTININVTGTGPAGADAGIGPVQPQLVLYGGAGGGLAQSTPFLYEDTLNRLTVPYLYLSAGDAKPSLPQLLWAPQSLLGVPTPGGMEYDSAYWYGTDGLGVRRPFLWSGGPGFLSSLGAGTPGTETGTSGLTFSANPIVDTGTLALSTTAVAIGTYGDSTHVGRFTVDQQGRLTAASSVSISASGIGAVTGSGAAGRVTVWDSATTVTGYAGLIYTDASNTLTVGGAGSTVSANVTNTRLSGASYAKTLWTAATAVILEAFADGLGTSGPAGGVAAGVFGTSTNHPIAFETNGTRAIWITTGQAVGLGTVSPGSTLGVVGGLSLGDSTYASAAAPTSGAIIKGSVYIGNSSAPASPGLLDVNGTITSRYPTDGTTTVTMTVAGGQGFLTTTASTKLGFYPGAAYAGHFEATGQLSLGEQGTQFTPTAWLHIGAGTAGVPQLRLTKGTLTTGGSILEGAIEWEKTGDPLMFTPTGGARYYLAIASGNATVAFQTLHGSLTANGVCYGGASAQEVLTLAPYTVTDYKVLGSIAGVPAWKTIDLTTYVSGILPLANGGTGSGSPGNGTWNLTVIAGVPGWAASTAGTTTGSGANHGVAFWTSATALSYVTVTATANQMLVSGASADPAWSTTTWPLTTGANTVLYSTGANTIGTASTFLFDGTSLLLNETTSSVRLGQRLSVAATATSAGAVMTSFSNAAADDGTRLDLNRSRSSTIGTQTIVQVGDTIGYVVFRGSNGTGMSTAAAIGAFCATTPSAGSYVPGYLAFFTEVTSGSGSPPERMRIDSTGLVGIATTAPSARLDVSSGALALVVGADSAAITRTNVTEKFGRIGAYHYTNAEEPVGLIMCDATSTNNLVLVGGGSSSLNAATAVLFYTAANSTTTTGTERMRIAAGGLITLGATSTDFTRLSQVLQISTAAAYGGMSVNTWSATAAEAGIVEFQRSKSATPGTHTVIVSGDAIGYLTWRASDGTAFRDAAAIYAVIDGTPGASDVPTMLKFATTPDGTAATVVRMQIRADGGITVQGAAGADPTGGSKGIGTFNTAGDQYKNGTAYTNPKWALKHYWTGDADREGPYAMAPGYLGLMSLDATEKYTRDHHELPTMDLIPDGGIFARGDLVLASLEEAYLHIFALNKRIKKLERRFQ